MAESLTRALRALGQVRAPASLAADVLARVGLGDSACRLDTPLGPLLVAWRRSGVTAARAVADRAAPDPSVPDGTMPAQAVTEHALREHALREHAVAEPAVAEHAVADRVVPRQAVAEPAVAERVAFEEWYRARFGRPLRWLEQPPAGLDGRLEAALRGARRRVRVDLDGLSDFERAVLLKTREIPRGEVRTYGWVAREIGRPAAVRAVGTALAHNPVLYLIPCHRVVRTDGRIGHYSGGGPAAKRRLLAAEGVDADRLEGLAQQGVRYYGSATTRVFCFPTCQHARRISSRHRVSFRDEAEALRAGYRACRRCRPAA